MNITQRKKAAAQRAFQFNKDRVQPANPEQHWSQKKAVQEPLHAGNFPWAAEPCPTGTYALSASNRGVATQQPAALMSFEFSLGGVAITAHLYGTDDAQGHQLRMSIRDRIRSTLVDSPVGPQPPELMTKAGVPTKSASAIMKYFNGLQAQGFTVDSEAFRKAHFSRKAT